MKKTLLLLLFAVTTALGWGQQFPQLSQYMFNLSFFNPGAVGSSDQICLSATARQQWTGFGGEPNSVLFNANAPFTLFKKDHGGGIIIYNDEFGFNNNLALRGSYAYRMDVADGKLGIGIGIGVYNYIQKAEWYIPESDFHTQPGSDESIPEGDGAFALDLSGGLFFKNENLYLGISSVHINQPQFTRFDKGLPFLGRVFNVNAGYNLKLSNPAFELKPSFMLMTDAKISQFTVNTTLVYNKRFWGGVSYRASNEAIAMLGIELKNGLRVGYSYDYGFSSLYKYNNGTHELSLGYCFSIVKEKIPQKYKSIRFL